MDSSLSALTAAAEPPPSTPKRKRTAREDNDSDFEVGADELAAADDDSDDEWDPSLEKLALASRKKVSGRRGGRKAASGDSSPSGSRVPSTPSPRKKRAPLILEPSPHKAGRFIQRVTFEDIPHWAGDKCPLFTMPSEIADRILSSERLGLRDHLSLAATCKTIRAAYPAPIWAALNRQRTVTDRHVNYGCGKEQDALDQRLLSSMFSARPEEPERVFPISAQHQEVVDAVHLPRMSQTESRSTYKLTVNQITVLKCKQHRNRKNPSHPIEMYLESAVEALAFRCHGGPDGHKEKVEKCKQQAERAKETRIRNGTQRTPRTSYYLYGFSGPGRSHNWPYGGYDFDPYYGGGYDSDYY